MPSLLGQPDTYQITLRSGEDQLCVFVVEEARRIDGIEFAERRAFASEQLLQRFGKRRSLLTRARAVSAIS
jgi:hypothetical protein